MLDDDEGDDDDGPGIKLHCTVRINLRSCVQKKGKEKSLAFVSVWFSSIYIYLVASDGEQSVVFTVSDIYLVLCLNMYHSMFLLCY